MESEGDTVSEVLSDGVTLEPMSVDVVKDCDTVSEDTLGEEVMVIIPLTNVSVLVVTDRVTTIIVPVRMDGVAVEKPVNEADVRPTEMEYDNVEVASSEDTNESVGNTVSVTVPD